LILIKIFEIKLKLELKKLNKVKYWWPVSEKI